MGAPLTITYNCATYFLLEIITPQVLDNVDTAQDKKKEYARRRRKGVKVYELKVGQPVLRRNMGNVRRKGGKMDVKCIGPCMLVDF